MNLLHTACEPAGGGPHPTLLALHGWGANAFDLLALAPHLAGGRFLVLCPQGPVSFPVGPGMNGFGWFPFTGGAPPDPIAFDRAVEALVAFLDAAQQRYSVTPDKVALLGFSQGGVMAYALALRQRRRFAAVAALSTWLPPSLADSAGIASFDQLPVLVQHGSGDQLVDAARGRESVEVLRRLGAAVAYREYDMGHEICAQSLNDLSNFLSEKVISPIVLA